MDAQTEQPAEEQILEGYNVPHRARVGEHVVWHDARGEAHDALVIAVWTPICINVVIVDPNEGATDSAGRQIARHTSQLHRNQQQVHGYYWRFSDEEPRPFAAPMET